MEFRALRREDDRSQFECGHPALDTFFRRFAKQNQFRHQIGVTYVLIDDNEIAGYVTVAAHSLQWPPTASGVPPRYDGASPTSSSRCYSSHAWPSASATRAKAWASSSSSRAPVSP